MLIGYGNTLRGDDAVGVLLAERLAKRELSTAFRVVTAHQLLPEMAVDIAAADRVLFADAKASGERATWQYLKPAAVAQDSWCGNHILNPAQLLRLARLFHDKAVPAWWICLPTQSFELGAPLTKLAVAGIEQAEHQVLACVSRWSAPPLHAAAEKTPLT